MRTHLDALDDEIAGLFAEVFAVTARALAKLAEFDALEGWAMQSFQSCAHYLNFRIGMSLGAAREHVRVARALIELPALREKFSAGTLSYSKVRALTRVVTPANEAAYLEVAEATTASQLEKIVRACRRVTLDEAQRQVEARSVDMGFDDDGMFFMRVRLMPDEGARLMHAIEALMPDDNARSFSERRADALMALGSSSSHTELVVHVDAGSVTTASVVAEVDKDAAGGQVDTPRGERVAVCSETARRLACDASLVVMTHDSGGNFASIGRRSRKIPAAMRRALAERDGGCRFPGCSNTLVDNHHVRHWADGGETTLGNLIQLCRFHHRRLHEGAFRMCVDADGIATFFNARGEHVGPPQPLRCVPAERAPLGSKSWGGTDWSARHIDLGLVVSALVNT